MAKKIFYTAEAREKVLAGAKQLYDAVKVTFGPKGQNVVIEKSYGARLSLTMASPSPKPSISARPKKTSVNKSAQSSSNPPLRSSTKSPATAPQPSPS